MSKKQGKKLKWWQLSILGIGFIIGTGFFLGSTIAIQLAGPAVIFTFLLAAIGTYTVYDVLGRMTANDPQQGSFSYYSKQAFGRWAGFSSGWVYWTSEMLIMGSQMMGISIFSRFWFGNIPLWVFAAIYTVLGIVVVLIGVTWFERLGNIFAITKLSAIIMFIILAILGLVGILKGVDHNSRFPEIFSDLFPNGFFGIWSALLFSFYAYGGIEIISIYATRLQDPKHTPKSGKVMLMLLTTIYIVSIGLSVILVPLTSFNMKESPFVVALNIFKLGFVPHVFNAILIIAGFSTMSASLFAVTTMLVNLAKDGNAPAKLGKEGKLTVPISALLLTTGGLVAAVILGLLLPDRVYEYLTTAAGLMLLYNWLFILFAAKKLLTVTKMDTFKRYLGTILIILAITGSVVHRASRPGFFVSLSFLLIIGIITFIMNRVWRREKGNEGSRRRRKDDEGIWILVE